MEKETQVVEGGCLERGALFFGGKVMIKNNYFAVVADDRNWFYATLRITEINSYNRQAIDCHQITEKVMKGIIEGSGISIS